MGNYQTKSIKLSDLILDLENPRHELFENQPDIISYMDEQELLVNLAKDIVNHGLSPLETIAVMKSHNGQYIVLEGNRRISALKILQNPDLLKEEKSRKQINSALKQNENFVLPNHVKCIIFPDRKSSHTWLQRKHGGQQNGAGTKSWNAMQQARFTQSIGNQNKNALSNALLEYAVQQCGINRETTKGIITTLTRFISNPVFRNNIGLSSKSTSNEIKLDISKPVFDKILAKIVADIVNKENRQVSSRSTKSNIKEYGEYLYKTFVLNIKAESQTNVSSEEFGTKNLEGLSSGDLKHNTTNFGVNTTKSLFDEGVDAGDIIAQIEVVNHKKHKPQKPINPAAREVLFHSLSLKGKDKHLFSLYYELKRLNVDNFPIATTMLARIFIETISRNYVESIADPKKSHSKAKMSDLIVSICKHCQSLDMNSNIRKSFKNFELLKENRSAALSPYFMGLCAHGVSIPSAQNIKTEWQNIEDFIQYMIDELENIKVDAV